MNRNKILGLLIASFLAGDALAVVRMNHHWFKQLERLRQHGIVDGMKIDALQAYIADIRNGTNLDEAKIKFLDAKAFIELIEADI